jgi:hypothetical protein
MRGSGSQKKSNAKLERTNRKKSWDDNALVGIASCVQLHQKGEKSMRQVVWQVIEGWKLLADCCLKGAKTEGFVPSVVFTALRQIEPFLRHFDERGTNPGIRSLPGHGQALGRHAPSFTRPIAQRHLCRTHFPGET